MKKIVKRLAKENDFNYNILKSIEELNELSLALTQYLTKGINKQEIIDEIGDVEIRIKILRELFNEKLIDKRIDFKIKKFKGYLKDKKYKGKI